MDQPSREDFKGETGTPVAVHNVPEGQVEIVSSNIYSVANVITLMRLLLVPFFFAVLIRGGGGKADNAAFLIFALAAVSDFLDGQIARRTGTVTAVGKLIDPLVDRLLIASGVVGLYIIDRLPGWVVVVLIARDLYLLGGSAVLEKRGLRMPVTVLGKYTTAVLLVAFASLIWNYPWLRLPALPVPPVGTLGGYRPIGGHLLYLGLAMSVTSALLYTVRAWRLVGGPRHLETPGASRKGE